MGSPQGEGAPRGPRAKNTVENIPLYPFFTKSIKSIDFFIDFCFTQSLESKGYVYLGILDFEGFSRKNIPLYPFFTKKWFSTIFWPIVFFTQILESKGYVYLGILAFF